MKSSLPLLGAFCCFVLLASAHARKSETGFLNRTVNTGGSTYRYQVFVPANWDKHKKWPVLLFLHGAGERGEDGLLQTEVGIGHAIRTGAAQFQFIVVMPQCWTNKLWTDSGMQGQALTALEQSIKEFHGDRDRVYTGSIHNAATIQSNQDLDRTHARLVRRVEILGPLQSESVDQEIGRC